MIMKMRRIEVESYSGGRADERPRRLIIDGREQIVARVLDSSLQEGSLTRERSMRFRVLTDEGNILEVVRAGDGRWYLKSERGPAQP